MSNTHYSAGILGTGRSLPDKELTNFDLEKMVDTNNEWIVKRTGISKRRILDNNQPTFNLGVDAARKALIDASLNAGDIDLIIVTTETPDYLTPSTACIIQREIGAEKASAFDLNAACSGFVYGLTVASQFIETGYYKNILVVACEGLSKVTDWEDRNTCILLADGAGAVVVGRVDSGYGILQTEIGAVGSQGHNLTLPCCYISQEDIEKRLHDNKRVIWMNGSEVLKFAVRIMESATRCVLEKEGLSTDNVSLVIPHQANIRIIDGAMKRLELPMEKAFVNIEKYANSSSASIPIALNEAIMENRIKKDDYIVLVGFGGGLTYGAALLKWK